MTGERRCPSPGGTVGQVSLVAHGPKVSTGMIDVLVGPWSTHLR